MPLLVLYYSFNDLVTRVFQLVHWFADADRPEMAYSHMQSLVRISSADVLLHYRYDAGRDIKCAALRSLLWNRS